MVMRPAKHGKPPMRRCDPGDCKLAPEPATYCRKCGCTVKLGDPVGAELVDQDNAPPTVVVRRGFATPDGFVEVDQDNGVFDLEHAARKSAELRGGALDAGDGRLVSADRDPDDEA